MNRFFNFFKADLFRKFMALILTVIIYWNLTGGKQKTRDIENVRVNFTSADVFINKDNAARFVNLTVKGPAADVDKLNNITANVILTTENKNGTVTVKLKPENFKALKNIKIIKISPEIIEVPVDAKISRDIKIEAVCHDEPMDGYFLAGTPRVIPERVTVTGPEYAFNFLKSIKTEPVSIKWDTKFQTQTKLLNPAPDKLTLAVDSVHVEVDIKKQIVVTGKFEKIPVKYLSRPMHTNERSRLVSAPVPATVTVTVSSDSEVEISKIKAEDIMVFTDLSSARYADFGTYNVPLTGKILTDTKAEITGISPAEVTVSVKQGR